jgi:hypothetical protein
LNSFFPVGGLMLLADDAAGRGGRRYLPIPQRGIAGAFFKTQSLDADASPRAGNEQQTLAGDKAVMQAKRC